MPDRLKVAVIGCGGIGNTHGPVYLKDSLAELIGYCDILPDRETVDGRRPSRRAAIDEHDDVDQQSERNVAVVPHAGAPSAQPGHHALLLRPGEAGPGILQPRSERGRPRWKARLLVQRAGKS